MSKKVNITIAGRSYPLTISEKEEATILAAEQAIGKNIDKLKQQYKINDPQDLLAMTVLEFASRIENKKNDGLSDDDKLALTNLKMLLENIN